MTGIRDLFGKKRQLSGTASNWRSDSRTSRTGALGDLSGLLLNMLAKEGANPVISPSCLYQMLAMLADISSGETRDQIISVLGEAEEVRTTLDALSGMDAPNYGCKDFHYSSGASLWLDDSVHASDGFDGAGRMIPLRLERISLGSESAHTSMSEWLSDNTGGIFVSAPSTREGDLLVGLTTMHLKDSWNNDFEEEGQREFTLDDGVKTTADFMLGWDEYDLLERNGSLTLSKTLSSGCFLVVSLPPAGTTLKSYIASGDAWANMESYASGEYTEKWLECRVHMPRFDLSSDGVDLVGALKDMGISRVFEPDADFSPLSTDALMVDSVLQSTHLGIDEEGLEGASYVAVLLCGGLPPEDPPKPRDIVIDRPFAVSVFTRSKEPLFVGAVTCPK